MRSSESAAGIVTFNPDIPRLRENLLSIVNQVTTVLVVDNGSSNFDKVASIVADFPNVELTGNASNGGIAKALNQIMAWAAPSTQWVLLLDQDTVVMSGMVKLLEAHKGPLIGIVAPTVVDRSMEPPSAALASAVVSEEDYCITSGSLCNVEAWNRSRGYDEKMFIDFVDFDYCLRLRLLGYRILRDPRAVILHEIGKITRHGPFTAYHYSAFRSYHMARDMLYYSRKHRTSPTTLRVHKRGILATYATLFRKMLVVALFEEDRVRRIAALSRGITSGTFSGHHARRSDS
ncbi:glycosyltransferase family 2 protein [Pseudarthrobacter sulfonivorans]|uniref:glycosyltransferase family 2 protein n=1 Tax=Pseudarthrobacter sulfonivorans TaxID=121292 RepID=UPI00277FDD58|nr:glycosyltransferase family 2 protein [Pseudarthrobacter sulfonivorans]MDQ0000520.1 rhamnosyltransferase [Pseudarthrobacter sulfonivorans]